MSERMSQPLPEPLPDPLTGAAGGPLPGSAAGRVAGPVSAPGTGPAAGHRSRPVTAARDDGGFAEFTDAWVRAFAASAAATEAELTSLDQRVGDGDFGANLLAGVQAALRLLTEAGAGGAGPASASVPGAAVAGGNGMAGAAGPSFLTHGGPRGADGPGPVGGTPVTATAAWPLSAAASAFLDEVGGTSGPLFGLLFQELAAAVAEADGTDYAEGSPGADPTASLALGVARGLAAIQRVGEASVGDKTLVDALAPAAAALQAQPVGSDPREALGRAADAAWEGVRGTARLTARRGRASYLGDRAAGVPDPGAMGVGLLFTAAQGPVTTLAPLLS
jgi:dihydroxyacetone kinase-like protein